MINLGKKFSLSAILLTVVFGSSVAFEFDDRLLMDMGIDNVDLSAFSGENNQFSGEYLANINLNGEVVFFEQKVNFYNKDDKSYVCFTKNLIDSLPLKSEIVTSLQSKVVHSTDVGDCLGFEQLDAAVNVDFNSNMQQLNITVPQLFLDNFDRDWVPPKQREDGIAGLFVDYSLLVTNERNKHSDNYNTFRANGVIGANFGKIRLRGNFQYDSERYSDNGKFEWSQRYAFMDIGSLNAKIFAGELYSRSNVFDSTRIKGFSFYSDENMMPAYLQGYAPQITGTANSNAIVTIKQYGGVIRTIQVPPGPFAISDLPSSLNGTVDVEIEEANGGTRQYQVDIAHVPFLTRKGAIRYSANVGRLSPLNTIRIGTTVVSADASYGVTDDISIFGGTMFTTNNEFRAINLGLGFNLGIFGAVSFDITESVNKADIQAGRKKGQSYRFNYAKKFGKSTTLNLVGYRFSSRNFTNIHNYVDLKSGNRNSQFLEKNRITLSMSQFIETLDSSLSVSLTKDSYWNRPSSSHYNITLSTSIKKGIFKNTSLQFSMMRYSAYTGTNENQYGVFVTIPLNDGYKERVQYDAQYSDYSHNIGQGATYYNEVFGGDVSFGTTARNKRDFSGSIDYSLNASYDKDLSFGRVQVTGNYSSDTQRLTSSLDGSLTLTQHGLATHQRVYENGPRLIVDVGAPNVSIGDGYNTSNIFGLTGISNIPSYYKAVYKVDNDNLPDNVEIQNSVIGVAVSDGAIAYRSLGAISGEKSISTIVLPDGSHPPFGAIVYRENGVGSEVAMVADKGLTYLTGLNNKAQFVVKWGKGSECKLKINSLNAADLEKIVCDME